MSDEPARTGRGVARAHPGRLVVGILVGLVLGVALALLLMLVLGVTGFLVAGVADLVLAVLALRRGRGVAEPRDAWRIGTGVGCLLAGIYCLAAPFIGLAGVFAG